MHGNILFDFSTPVQRYNLAPARVAQYVAHNPAISVVSLQSACLQARESLHVVLLRTEVS